ncbi:EAL domain-containing protein [Halomonas sp. 86]|uniref:EAL domain-containing protein n=1 Tax=Halomonas sp. 86 TaxID=3457737 RepID=UPI0040337422
MKASARMAFQPIVCSQTGSYRAYEVLARFQSGVSRFDGPSGHVMPGEWAELDLWIINSLRDWSCHGNQLRHPLYINLSTETMSDDDTFELWIERYHALFGHINTPVVLELNEKVSGDVIDRRWSPLAGLNVGLALDDFGSDNASLDRLHAFPWTTCKFQSQCLGLGDSPAGLRYAQDRMMLTIVERVESALDVRRAKAAGVSLHQGYYYARPRVVASEYAVIPSPVALAEVAL